MPIMSSTPDFRQLVERVQNAGRKPGQPPVTLTRLAKRCGTVRQYLYNLMEGLQIASICMEERLALGLKVSLASVRAALSESRRKVS